MKQIPVLALILCAPFLYTSCGAGKTNEENVKSDSARTVATVDPALEEILSLFEEVKNFPYRTDSAAIEEAKGDSLGTDQVKILAGSWLEHSLTNAVEAQLEEFYTIDSIKAAGKYSEWVEGLDIGMTKYANAYALHKLQLDEKTWVLTWVLKTASYEACPYFSGTYVYATLVYEGKPTHGFLLGENMGAGDPPVSMGREVGSELTADGKLHIREFEENDDMDAEYSTQVSNEYWLVVQNGKFVPEKENKGKEMQVPHAPEVTEE